MGYLETQPFKQAEYFRDYYHTFRAGSVISRTRVLLEHLSETSGIKIGKVPLGGKADALDILTFLESARQGYFLDSKAAFMGLNKALKVIRPRDTAASLEMIDVKKAVESLGINWGNDDLDVTVGPKNLTAYLTAVAILTKLSAYRMVSFAQIPSKPDKLDLGKTEVTPSFWQHSLDPETIWECLKKLHEQTTAVLYSSSPVGTDIILPPGHFFSTGLLLFTANKTQSKQ